MTVTVHKPQAPVGVPFGDVTVAVTRRRPPVPVVVAVGANLPRGEQRPHDTVRAAVDALAQHADVTVVSVSGLHDTEPVGGPEQPTYVNAVVTARTSLSPTSLLRALHGIEAAFDRRREVRWGARTLDLDLVQYGDPASDADVTSDLPRLTLPHPRAHERAFVLVPWLEADPAAVLRHEGRAVPVADLVAGLDTTGVRPRPTDPTARPPTEDTRTDAAQRDPREDPRPGRGRHRHHRLRDLRHDHAQRLARATAVAAVRRAARRHGRPRAVAGPPGAPLPPGARDDLARPAARRPHRGAGAGRRAHRRRPLRGGTSASSWSCSPTSRSRRTGAGCCRSARLVVAGVALAAAGLVAQRWCRIDPPDEDDDDARDRAA